METMSGSADLSSSKILDLEGLVEARRAARASGRRVVQCHGCFDIVHPGHIRHLRQAKAMGDVLLVSITGDSWIGKGAGRPLIPEELRAENLAAIDFVDWVHVDPHASAVELLERVAPDVYVKGKEYEHNRDPRFAAERDAVERGGGRVVFSSGDIVFSSTALIAAMEQSVDPFHKRLATLSESPELSANELGALMSRFRGRRVVVVGEVILDTYVLCDRPEVAGESPVMTLRPIERRRYDGGAAILARHLAAMGARPVLVTAMPDDHEGQAMRRRLTIEGVDIRSIPVSCALPEKQRFLVGSQKVMKLDLVEPLVLDASQQRRLVELAVEASAAEGGGMQAGGVTHAAIITDFGLGLFSPVSMSRLCTALRPLVGVLAGDVSGRRSNLSAMHHMDLLTPSEGELRESCRMFGEGLPLVVWKMLEDGVTGRAIVTMGAEGLIGFERLPGVPIGESGSSRHSGRSASRAALAEDSGPVFQTKLRSEHVPALCPMGVDPLGCGDSLLAAATLALSCGGSLLAASFLGACAAAAQVKRLGNVPISAGDLRAVIAQVHGSRLAYAPTEHIESTHQVTRGPAAAMLA